MARNNGKGSDGPKPRQELSKLVGLYEALIALDDEDAVCALIHIAISDAVARLRTRLLGEKQEAELDETQLEEDLSND